MRIYRKCIFTVAYIKRIDIKNLSLEIFINMIQPYPYIHYEFTINIMGNNVTYSLNMFLFIISVSRLYVIINFLKFWLPFSSDNSKRLL